MSRSKIPKNNLKLSLFDSSRTQEVIELFASAFSASEGESEGQLIGDLVVDLIANTKPQDLIGCIAISSNCIVGSIFFSRFTLPGDEVAFIMAPVAVSTLVQGRGIGQQLINYGLDQLRSLGVDLAVTYGDPNYYSKSGFSQIGEDILSAPFELSQPEGWLAQSLDGNPIKVMPGKTICVEALSDQKYW